MAMLQCGKCSYEFERERIPAKCPYCAAENTVMPYKTAQDWLDESEY